MTRDTWVKSFAVFGGDNYEDQCREIEVCVCYKKTNIIKMTKFNFDRKHKLIFYVQHRVVYWIWLMDAKYL